MGGSKTEKDIIDFELQSRARLHHAERWPLLLIGGLVQAIAGAAFEAYFVNRTTADTLQDANGQLSTGATAMVWILTLAVPLALAVVLHRFVIRRGKSELARIDTVLGVMGIVSILALPILMAKARGVGLGNPFDEVATTDAFTSSTYLVAELMRLPVVLILAFVSSLGVRLILVAVDLREAERRDKARITAAVIADDDLVEGLQLQKSQGNRMRRNHRQLGVGFTRALSTAVEIKVEHILRYATGADTVTTDFISQLDADLKRGLSGYPKSLIDLVEETCPSGIDFEALPADARDLCPEDQRDLIDHALWLRQTYSIKNVAKGLAQ